MVHGLNQIIELNNHAYLVEMAIKEGLIEPTPATVRLTEEQLDELKRLGYLVDAPDYPRPLSDDDF